jgi:biopolymer transport protein ExbB
MKTPSILNRISMALRVIALLASFAVFVPIPVRAQAAPAPTEDAAKAAPKKKTLFDDIKQGGIVMVPIVICSVFTIYLVVDMYSRLSMKKLAPEEEVAKARQFFLAGDYVNCYQAMKAVPCAFNNCVKYGLSFVGKGKEQTEDALLTEVGRENNRLQNRINYLSVIGVCTPMIGLLGTVVGMMGAFAALGESGAGDTSKLSQHIGEVLVATASGLFIAIPAFMFFYILRNRLAKQIHELEDTVMSLYRNMPYDYFNGLEIGEEVTYAAVPNWIEDGAPAHA